MVCTATKSEKIPNHISMKSRAAQSVVEDMKAEAREEVYSQLDDRFEYEVVEDTIARVIKVTATLMI